MDNENVRHKKIIQKALTYKYEEETGGRVRKEKKYWSKYHANPLLRKDPAMGLPAFLATLEKNFLNTPTDDT